MSWFVRGWFNSQMEGYLQMRVALSAVAVLAGCLAVCPAPAAAEETLLLLASGGQVRGTLLNPSEFPRQTYQIETAYGVRLTLPRELVHQAGTITDKRLEYEQVAPTYPDTLEGQWKLAEWCREKNMRTERETHLARVLDFDPDHEQARRALGYFLHGKNWVTQEEMMNTRGFVKYKGEWLLPEEVELREKRRQAELQEKAWMRQVADWKRNIGSRSQEILAQMQEVRDPYAVSAISYHMTPAREPRPAVRLAFVDVLVNINTLSAWKLIGEITLNDPNEEVRVSAREKLRGQKQPELVKLFVSRLKHPDNHIVNRAALGLGMLGDDTAIGPLIDALVTTHQFRIVKGRPGTTTTFSSNGGGGLSVGQQAEVHHKQFNNEPVRDVLIHLTKVNFQFDQEQWRAWHASYLRARAVDTRRNENN